MTEQKRGKRLAKYVPDYVMFDLETTGMSATDDAIIEISAVRVRNGEAAGTFSTLVNPQCAIPYSATRVNGITDEMVAEAPRISGRRSRSSWNLPGRMSWWVTIFTGLI